MADDDNTGGLGSWAQSRLNDFAKSGPGALKNYDASIDSAAAGERSAYNQHEGALNAMGDQRATILGGLAAGLLSPTRGGTFSESLGKGMTNANDAYEKNRSFEMDRGDKIQSLQLARAKLAMEAQRAHLDATGIGLDMIGKAGAANSAVQGLTAQDILRQSMLQPGTKPGVAAPVAPSPQADASPAVAPAAPAAPPAPATPGPGPAPTAGNDPPATAVPSPPPGPPGPPVQAADAGQGDPDAPAPGAAPVEFVTPGSAAGASGVAPDVAAHISAAKQAADVMMHAVRTGKINYATAQPYVDAYHKAVEDAAGAKGFGWDGNKLVPQGDKSPDYLGSVAGAQEGAKFPWQAAMEQVKVDTKANREFTEFQDPQTGKTVKMTTLQASDYLNGLNKRNSDGTPAAPAPAGAPAGLQSADPLAKERYATNVKPYTEAYTDYQNAREIKTQAQQMMSVMFDPKTGKPLVNAGPAGPFINESAALMKQAGFSDKFIQQWTHTDPTKADELEKLKTSMGTEIARQTIGPGSQLRVTEFNQFLKNTPNDEMLPGAFKWMIEHDIMPKADFKIKRWQSVSQKDPERDNILGHLTKFDQDNPMIPQNNDAALGAAKAAIAAGKDRNAVIQRLKEHGIDPSGL